MPNPLPKTGEPQKDRKYQVIRGNVGAWTLGSVFTESKFRELVDAPKDGDVDAHYGALLNRLVMLGVARVVPAETPETPTPVGPEGQTGVSSSIEAAAKAVLSQRAAQAESIGIISPDVVAPTAVKQGAQQGAFVPA